MRKRRINESRLRSIVRNSVKRVLNEGSPDQNLYNQWLDIQESVGAERFLDCIWNWLSEDDLAAIVSYAIEDELIPDPAENDEEDWNDDDEDWNDYVSL